jgi:luciferase family oxidoreductase group 1
MERHPRNAENGFDWVGMMRVPISILDLAPVASNGTAAAALRDTTVLAGHAEKLGCLRFWVAEHHNDPMSASSSPAILIAHIAANTSTIRVGSGGVMLSNHAPLVVAEQFGTLEGLHPGRIDLGIGRAPGANRWVVAALRRAAGPFAAEDFGEEVGQLLDFLTGEAAGPAVAAIPAADTGPMIWMLGASTSGARTAARFGLPFAFAHHINAQNMTDAVELYRAEFRPSRWLQSPHIMVSVSVICAETSAQAELLAGATLLADARVVARHLGPGPASAPERALIAQQRRDLVVGDPASVGRQLADIVARSGSSELMLTSRLSALDERLRTYTLVAEHVGVDPRASQGGPSIGLPPSTVRPLLRTATGEVPVQLGPVQADQAAVFVAGGLAAVAAATGRRWIQVGLAPRDGQLDALLVRLNELRLQLATGSGSTNCFFMRKPPGLRLRVETRPSERDALERELYERLEGMPEVIDRLEPGIYEPEEPLFGGPASMPFVHDIFTVDSAAWLALNALRTRDSAWVFSLAMQRQLLAGLEVVGWEDIDVWTRIGRQAGRTLPDQLSTDRVHAAAERIRGLWSESDRLTSALSSGAAEVIEHYGPRLCAAAGRWRTGYFGTRGAAIGPREGAALVTIFHWNRGGVSPVTQGLIATALADRSMRP